MPEAGRYTAGDVEAVTARRAFAWVMVLMLWLWLPPRLLWKAIRAVGLFTRDLVDTADRALGGP